MLLLFSFLNAGAISGISEMLGFQFLLLWKSHPVLFLPVSTTEEALSTFLMGRTIKVVISCCCCSALSDFPGAK